jgi:hypothetical protein
MRLLALILALFTIAGPASAQGWNEYAYPDYAFTVAFPAVPRIETATFEAADGRPVAAQVYSVTQDNNVFKLTIAKLDPAMEERAVIEHAVRALAKTGEIKVNIEHRINWIYGRQLSITGSDGSYSLVALFYYKQRLYQIEGTVPADSSTGDAVRFQQSLTFTD